MNERELMGIAFLVVIFLVVSYFLFIVLGAVAIIPVIAIAIAGISGWVSGGNDSNNNNRNQ